MLNHVVLMGRLAQDPEVRTTTNNTSVASFNLAVQGYSKDAPPDYIPIVCWKETANLVGRYLTKGRQIAVEGRISTRKYTDKEGKNRKIVEVTASRIYFADSNGSSKGANDPEMPTDSDAPPEQPEFEEIGGDEDLPF